MKIIFIAAIALFSITAYGQTSDNYNELLVKFNERTIKQLEKDNPEELNFLSYCVHNAFYITDLPKEKLKTSPERIKSIKLNSLENINFFSLDINILDNDYQYFRIEGTDKLLVVKSKKHIKQELK